MVLGMAKLVLCNWKLNTNTGKLSGGNGLDVGEVAK